MRRRRPRKRRRRKLAPAPAERTAPAVRRDQAPARAAPDWRWRTFPVFFAFVVGVFVMGLLAGVPVLAQVLFFASLAGLGFGVAHILTRQVLARRR